MRDIQRIVIHHSASPRETTVAQISEWHRAKGWDGIGYHYVIDGNGIIRSTRALDRMGAHAKGANQGSIGICVTGNNTVLGDSWTDAQRDSLVKLVRALRIALGPLEFTRHCDVGTTATECPGLTDEEWQSLLGLFHA